MHILEDYGLSYKDVKILCYTISTINLTKNPIDHLKIKYLTFYETMLQREILYLIMSSPNQI